MINILTVSINTTVHTLIQLVHYIPSQMIDGYYVRHKTCLYLCVQSSCVVVVVGVAQPGQLCPQPGVLRLQLLHPLLAPPQRQVLPGHGVPRLHQLQDRLLHSLQPATVIPEHHHRSHLEILELYYCCELAWCLRGWFAACPCIWQVWWWLWSGIEDQKWNFCFHHWKG